jgi:hypothetical protein
MFGRQYAQGREEYSYGKVVNVKGKMVNVLYEDDNVEWKSHETHLTKVFLMAMPEDTMATASGSRPIFHAYINGGVRVRSRWFDKEYSNEGWFKGNTDNNAILPVLELNSELASSANDGTGNLPRDFWQALVSPQQWREWVSSTQ